METFFSFSDQIEPPDVEAEDPLASNYTAMIDAILSQTPDPRLC